VITTNEQLAELIPRIQGFDRVAVDTEADSLHCYFEKLCLIQLTFDGNDHLIDPLAPIDCSHFAARWLTAKWCCREWTSICGFCAAPITWLPAKSSTR
jgi:ribonuclease D